MSLLFKMVISENPINVVVKPVRAVGAGGVRKLELHAQSTTFELPQFRTHSFPNTPYGVNYKQRS
jgi:hypothetical protein